MNDTRYTIRTASKKEQKKKEFTLRGLFSVATIKRSRRNGVPARILFARGEEQPTVKANLPSFLDRLLKTSRCDEEIRGFVSAQPSEWSEQSERSATASPLSLTNTNRERTVGSVVGQRLLSRKSFAYSTFAGSLLIHYRNVYGRQVKRSKRKRVHLVWTLFCCDH